MARDQIVALFLIALMAIIVAVLLLQSPTSLDPTVIGTPTP
jgi:hypothetical protein